ncbi:hypothetical protein MNBD_ALPHA06-2315, partial [hydrothermal vent metagenome]
SVFADDGLKPFIQGASETEDVAAALTEAGFEIVGEYSPYAGAQIIFISSKDLRVAASQSEFGGYAAALRVSITDVDGARQIAYNNPAYVSNIYRMNNDLASVQSALEAALGNQGQFGAKKGLSIKKLRKYRYKIGMAGFKGHMKLASYDSHAAAIAAVEAGLAQGKMDVGQVYRVDLDDKEQTLIGVSLGAGAGEGADVVVMQTADQGAIRATPHLSYEMLVSGNDVYMLGARFRIAQSFPSLTMGTFIKIINSPGDIKKALKEAANGAE